MDQGREPRRFGPGARRFRRGIFLLPTLFTVGNLFCGYASVVHAMRGELSTAAALIGIAIVLDMLDGRIARLTGTTSAFGLELDSLADVVSFGLAPAVLTFAWGLGVLGRWGWAAGFLYVTAAAMRLARFNIQALTAHSDKRYFLGMPTPPAAGVPAATVFAYPYPLETHLAALGALAVVIVPAVLMVSRVRFRSFKTINLGWGPSYMPVILFAALIVFIATEPRVALVILAYSYLLSAFLGLAITRFRPRRNPPPPAVLP